MKTHDTLGPLASIEGHTRDGRPFTLDIADVRTGHDGVVLSCVLHSNTPDLVYDDKGKLDLVYPTKTRPLRTPTGATRDTMAAKYTALHEGRAPGSWWLDEPRVGASQASFALVIDAVSYVKTTTESSLHLYRHPIELSENSKPTLAIGRNQELWFRNQDSVRVTERGIEDMTSGIKRSGDSRPNPLTQENIQRAALSSFMAGGAGLLWTMGVRYGISMLPPSVQQYATGYLGAGLKAGLGIVTAVVVDSYVPPEYRPVAAGIGVGGVVDGGMQAITQYTADHPAAPATGLPYPTAWPTGMTGAQWEAANPGTHAGVRPPGAAGSFRDAAHFGAFGGQTARRRTG